MKPQISLENQTVKNKKLFTALAILLIILACIFLCNELYSIGFDIGRALAK